MPQTAVVPKRQSKAVQTLSGSDGKSNRLSWLFTVLLWCSVCPSAGHQGRGRPLVCPKQLDLNGYHNHYQERTSPAPDVRFLGLCRLGPVCQSMELGNEVTLCPGQAEVRGKPHETVCVNQPQKQQEAIHKQRATLSEKCSSGKGPTTHCVPSSRPTPCPDQAGCAEASVSVQRFSSSNSGQASTAGPR